MGELERELFLAHKRLLTLWCDWYITGEDCSELLEETKYLINYDKLEKLHDENIQKSP